MASYYGPNDIVSPYENRTLKKKPEPTSLNAQARRLLHAMWYGVDRDITLNSGEIVPARSPLSDYEAARALGMPGRILRYWQRLPVFREAVRQQGLARRQSEEPSNLARALQIRDYPALTPDDRRVQLAAIDRIRVKDPAPAVHVDFSSHTHDNRQQTVVQSAGYVVNLGEPMKIEEKE